MQITRAPVVEVQPPDHGTDREFPEVWLIKLQTQIQSTVGRSSGCGRNHLRRRCCSWKRQPGPSQRPALWEAGLGDRTWERSRGGPTRAGSVPFTRPYLLPSGWTHTEHSLSPRTLLAPSSSCADILIVLLWEPAGSLSSGMARRGARARCWLWLLLSA